MRIKVEINKKVADIFSELWLERGCPVTMDFGRTHNGMVDALLEYEDSDHDMVNELMTEAKNIYAQKP